MILKQNTFLQIGGIIRKQLNVHGIFARPLSAFVQKEQQIVVVCESQSPTETSLKFPGIWLRDNCLCDQCFHKNSQSRIPMRWHNFDCEVKVENVSVDEENKAVHVSWSDKHKSDFPWKWLKERSFAKEHQEKYLSTRYRPKPHHWSKEEFLSVLKIFEYDDIMYKDDVLKEWLESIAVYGVSVLKNTPLEFKATKAICNRVGLLRKTTYGDEFVVKSRPNGKNYAYLSQPLPLQTAMPYFEYKPSVTILHTLEQSPSAGGHNILADGFHIADILKEKYPDYFKILTETKVNWFDISRDDNKVFHNILRSPVINIDTDGSYTRINHSVTQRDSHFTIDIDQVVPWYKANAAFVRLANERMIELKTNEGDVLCFNNLRVLHGRTRYDDAVGNLRFIVGSFVDWDIIYSKLRVLKGEN